jgi:acyl carrier protein
MQSYPSVLDRINRFLSQEFEVDITRIQPQANLREVLNLDSLDFIDLVVFIENNFSFKVNPGDFTQMIRFQDFYSYIIYRLQIKENTNVLLER